MKKRTLTNKANPRLKNKKKPVSSKKVVKKVKKTSSLEKSLWLFEDIYTIQIINNLLNKKESKFTSLKEEIKDVCDATLSKSLKTLHDKGIIEKEQQDTFPRTIKYSLTKKGKAYNRLIKEIEKISKKK